jgi:hypothetical protein
VRRVRQGWVALAALFGTLVFALGARAQEAEGSRRGVDLYWSEDGQQLYADVEFNDVVDEPLRRKLTRGLPTTILFTALLERAGASAPIATTVQSCRITWHVWEELYRVDVSRPGTTGTKRHWTPTVRGVLRRCAAAEGLLVAEAAQVPRGMALVLKGTVRVNPVSKELLDKIKRWVSRPSSTATAAPGSAIFSTFTGLFMARVGSAEKTVTFSTIPVKPRKKTP